jgi:hypothetical protein
LFQARRHADLVAVHGEQKPIFSAEGTPGNGALDADGRADGVGGGGGVRLHGVESDQHGVAPELGDDAPGRSITLHRAVKYSFSAPISALGSSFSEIIESSSMSANSTLACLASPSQAWIRSSAVVMRLATSGATKRERSWAAALPTAA